MNNWLIGGTQKAVLVKNTGGIYFLNQWGLNCYTWVGGSLNLWDPTSEWYWWKNDGKKGFTSNFFFQHLLASSSSTQILFWYYAFGWLLPFWCSLSCCQTLHIFAYSPFLFKIISNLLLHSWLYFSNLLSSQNVLTSLNFLSPRLLLLVHPAILDSCFYLEMLWLSR